jgi:hypothetical protein
MAKSRGLRPYPLVSYQLWTIGELGRRRACAKTCTVVENRVLRALQGLAGTTAYARCRLGMPATTDARIAVVHGTDRRSGAGHSDARLTLRWPTGPGAFSAQKQVAQSGVARTAAFAVRVSSLVRRGSERTATTKYPSEPNGRRDLDRALNYNTVDMIATEKTRTAKPAVRATCYREVGGDGRL